MRVYVGRIGIQHLVALVAGHAPDLDIGSSGQAGLGNEPASQAVRAHVVTEVEPLENDGNGCRIERVCADAPMPVDAPEDGAFGNACCRPPHVDGRDGVKAGIRCGIDGNQLPGLSLIGLAAVGMEDPTAGRRTSQITDIYGDPFAAAHCCRKTQQEQGAIAESCQAQHGLWPLGGTFQVPYGHQEMPTQQRGFSWLAARRAAPAVRRQTTC